MQECFAHEKGRCNILTVKECTEPCNFFKAKKQLVEDRAKSNERLMTLDDEFYANIMQTYYPSKKKKVLRGKLNDTK